MKIPVSEIPDTTVLSLGCLDMAFLFNCFTTDFCLLLASIGGTWCENRVSKLLYLRVLIPIFVILQVIFFFRK